MGNASKKLAEQCTLLTKDEQKSVAATFRAASRNSNKIREDELIVSARLDAVLLDKLWGPQIDPRLAQYLTNYLFGSGDGKQPYCDFNKFAELYVFNVRGTVEERQMVIYRSLGQQEGADIPFQLLKEYCESIASTYMKVLKAGPSSLAMSWIEKGFRGRAAHVQALGEGVAASVGAEGETTSTSRQVDNWLISDTLLKHMTEVTFSSLYGIHRDDGSHPESQPSLVQMRSLLPAVEGLESMPDYPAFIDISHIVWLNNSIPAKHRHKWRFLFSSHIHGESFSTMCGRIIDQGPSLLIVEDNSGHIFGGYAAQPWHIGPSFYGNEESFLFSLSPRMRVFSSTGFNNHYQYINQNTKTLPNGLLMGGQFEFGGIWIPADPFGGGSCAESCTTYRNYKRPSKEGTFRIKSLEVWGVGDKPLSIKDSDERDTSVLDGNTEAKAILEMAGRKQHSEGIREPPPL